MFRYTTIVWNPSHLQQARVAEAMLETMRAHSNAWQAVLSRPGLRVYCSGIRPGSSEAHSLHNNAGVVLGTIFTRVELDGTTPRKATFGPSQTDKLLATQGRELTENYWGRYVAFLFDPDSESVCVVRSPSGALDCLSAQVQGVRLFFSRLEDCPLLDASSLSVNWDYVAAELTLLIPETRATGFVEIERIMRGECVCIAKDQLHRRAYWHPFRFVENSHSGDVGDAMKALRTTAHACVHAWASCYNSIITLLSGGLDSSILMASLRDAPAHPRVVGLNLRNPHDTISDERTYARMCAQHTGFPLVEQEQRGGFSLEPLLRLPKSAYPWLNIFDIGNAEPRSRIAKQYATDAYFSGHGGDQIFFSTAARYMCADFVHRHFLKPRVVSVALQAAYLEGLTLFGALRGGIRDGLRRDPLQPVERRYGVASLIRTEAIEDVRRKRLFIPHWFDGAVNIPPGKCWQVISLTMPEGMHSMFESEDGPELVFPLLSQPLQELCLQIPSYDLAHGGMDRGLARFAFKQDLPAQILSRQSKGGVYEYLKAIWRPNLPFVRELLLDGTLVKQRIVDRAKLEKTLSGDIDKEVGAATEVCTFICAEAWLRGLSDASAKRAA